MSLILLLIEVYNTKLNDLEVNKLQNSKERWSNFCQTFGVFGVVKRLQIHMVYGVRITTYVANVGNLAAKIHTNYIWYIVLWYNFTVYKKILFEIKLY